MTSKELLEVSFGRPSWPCPPLKSLIVPRHPFEFGLRFAIGGINIETNSFSGKKADLPWFKSIGYYEGKDLLTNLGHTNSAPGGIIDAAEAFGWELVPSVVTTPLGAGGGVVTRETM